MADRWFRVPTETIEWTDSDGNVISSADGPKYRDLDGITGFSGNTIGNNPMWVVRYYGDTTTLDEIASKSDSQELTDVEAVQKFENAKIDNIPDKNWDKQTMNDRFSVNTI